MNLPSGVAIVRYSKRKLTSLILIIINKKNITHAPIRFMSSQNMAALKSVWHFAAAHVYEEWGGETLNE